MDVTVGTSESTSTKAFTPSAFSIFYFPPARSRDNTGISTKLSPAAIPEAAAQAGAGRTLHLCSSPRMGHPHQQKRITAATANYIWFPWGCRLKPANKILLLGEINPSFTKPLRFKHDAATFPHLNNCSKPILSFCNLKPSNHQKKWNWSATHDPKVSHLETSAKISK